MDIYIDSDHDWEHSVYGKHEEDIAVNLPEPLGKRIVLTHYFDTSLMYSTTRLLLTGIASSNLHLKQLPTVQSSYLEENIVSILLITKHTFDILESHLVKWTMYGETMRV